MKDLLLEIDHGGPFFVVLGGLPGVGKSTCIEPVRGEAVILSTDDYIAAKAEDEGTTYDALWESTIKEATSAMQAGMRHALKDRASIVVDRTNLSAKKRCGLLAQLPKEYYKIALVFETPDAEEHAKRLDRPGKVISQSIIDTMKQHFTQPTIEEGWDLISVVPVR